MKYKSFKYIGTTLLVVTIQCKLINTQAQKTDIINKDNLINHLEEIASDKTEGRFSATKGYKLAADYAAKVFKDGGLKPVLTGKKGKESYFQYIPFIQYNFDESFIEINKKGIRERFKHSLESYVVLHPGINENVSKLTTPIFVGYGIYEPSNGWNDYSNVDVNGKWVVMLDGIPFQNNNTEFPEVLRKRYSHWKAIDSLKYAALKKHNALGVIVLPGNYTSANWETEALRTYRFNYTQYGRNDLGIDTFRSDIPYLLVHPKLSEKVMSHQVYNPIASEGEYQTFELQDLELEINISYERKYTNCQNIVASVPGTDSLLRDEYLTVGAHLDHLGQIGNNIYNGANDNAGSCAIILEAAKYLALNPAKRSVLFILYTSEEQHLIGSKYFLKNSPIPVESIALNINIEQVGSINREYSGIWIISPNEFMVPFQNASNAYKDVEFVFDFIGDYRSALSTTDTWSYITRDIPAIMMSSGGFPEYHSPKDKIDLIDYKHLYFASKFLYSFLVELGNMLHL